MNELVKLTAREAVVRLKKREITPLDLVEAAAERIAEVDGQVNALPTLCLDRARERARRLMAQRGEERPPWFLHGLPIAVKDLEDVEGVRTTYASPIFADNVPARTDLSPKLLEENGAIVVAKSNTPEFGAGANTFNEVFGATSNPWRLGHTCGGSSGGSAVALATGQVWLATGSDLGGSLRIPAAFCSVVGFRPSPGRVPLGPDQMPWQSLSVHGPMGRTAGDVALMLDAEVGQVPEDPRSLPRPEKLFTQAVDEPLSLKRVAFSPNLGLTPVDPEVEALCRRAAQAFGQTGAVVEEDHPDLHDAEWIFQVLRAGGYGLRLVDLLDKHRDKLKPEIIWNIEKGLKLGNREIVAAEMARGDLYQRTVAFFKNFDLLLCPTVICPPFDLKIRFLEEFGGVRFESYISWLILTFALTLTACPAVSVPCGFTKSGLPVGLQIVGPPRGEAQVLSGAALHERLSGLSRLTPMDPRPGPEE